MSVLLKINNQPLDTFEDEGISITTRVKDVRDITKLYDDFSQQFSIPASGNNNAILSRFPDNSIIDPKRSGGWDVNRAGNTYTEYRKRQPAELSIDGVLFKVGFIKYDQAVYQFGKLSHHLVTFAGAVSTLTEIMGDSMLKDLNLTEFAYGVTADNVRLGMDYNGVLSDNKIIYPLMSNTAAIDQAVLESGLVPHPVDPTEPDRTLEPKDFRPAIRTQEVLNAIAALYPEEALQFIFPLELNMSNVYLWLSNDVGNKVEGVLYPNEPTFDSGDQADVNLETGVIHVPRTHYLDNVSFRTHITVPAGIEWTIRGQASMTGEPGSPWKDIETMTASGTGPMNDVGLYFDIVDERGEFNPEQEQEYWRFYIEAQPTAGNIVMEIGGRPVAAGHTDPYLELEFPFDTASGGNLADRMPDISQIDFLVGLVKLMNLVPRPSCRRGDFDLIPYDKWIGTYACNDRFNGWDITSDVDMTSHQVVLPTVYKKLAYKYLEPKAWKNKHLYYDVRPNNRGYGDYIETNSEALGEEVDEEIKFENMAWIGGKPPVATPYLVAHAFSVEGVVLDANGVFQPAGEEKPVFDRGFLCIWDKSVYGTLANGDPDTTADVNINVDGFAAPVTKYKMCNSFDEMPIESYSLPETSPQITNTLNFSDESDFFRYGGNVEGYNTRPGSFTINYIPYIFQITNESARLHIYDVVLPLSKLSQIDAASYIKIWDNWFFINSMSTDTLSLVTKMELITYFRDFVVSPPSPDLNPPTPAHPVFPIGNLAPTVPMNLLGTNQTSSGFTLSWDASVSPDGFLITSYEIWRLGSLWTTVTGTPAPTTVALLGVPPNDDASNWYVRGVDENGLISDYSEPWNWLPAVGPTWNGVITVEGTTGTTMDISWLSSTPGSSSLDYYDVYLDGVLVGTTGVINYTYTGLTNGQTYSIKVVIVDVNGLFDESPSITHRVSDVDPPTGLVATNITFTDFDLSWTAPIGGTPPDGYKVYRNNFVVATLGNVTTYHVAGEAIGSTSTWTVKAIAGGFLSDVATPIDVTLRSLEELLISSTGYADDIDACGSLSGVQGLFHNGDTLYPEPLDVVFTTFNGSTTFNGHGDWYYDSNGNRAYEIGTNGEIFSVVLCP